MVTNCVFVRERGRENFEDYETVNKERLLLLLKGSSLESISTLASIEPWIDLSNFGFVDMPPFKRALSKFVRL